MKHSWILVGLLSLFISTSAWSDTLYQANVGGYQTGVGVGVGVNNGYSTYTSQSSYGYSPNATSGVPYDTFTYPYSSGCCGCNVCDNCGTSYSIRCR